MTLATSIVSSRPTTNSPNAPTSADLRRGSESGRNLGRFNVSVEARDSQHYYDRGSRHTLEPKHLEFRAGGRVGSTTGYASLSSAIEALSELTAPVTQTAVGVIKERGRFYGYELKSRDLERGIFSALRGVNLQTTQTREVVSLRGVDRYDRLAAIVDGSWSHRFNG